MCPIYAVLAAPLTRPLRVPILLWFTHWRESRLLHLAERVSSAVVTVEPRSFPFATRKLVPIGHGIDLADFSLRERRRARTARCGLLRSAAPRRRRGSRP